MIVIPFEDGLDVVIWGRWTQGSMRIRRFDNRTSMIALLEVLHLLSSQEAEELENYVFIDYCPLFSCEIEEDVLAAHGFQLADRIPGTS
jgi:hypothetical protein